MIPTCARIGSARISQVQIGRVARASVTRALGDARGQGLVEAVLILAIAVVVAAIAIVVFGPQLAAILDFIGAQVQQ